MDDFDAAIFAIETVSDDNHLDEKEHVDETGIAIGAAGFGSGRLTVSKSFQRRASDKFRRETKSNGLNKTAFSVVNSIEVVDLTDDIDESNVSSVNIPVISNNSCSSEDLLHDQIVVKDGDSNALAVNHVACSKRKKRFSVASLSALAARMKKRINLAYDNSDKGDEEFPIHRSQNIDTEDFDVNRNCSFSAYASFATTYVDEAFDSPADLIDATVQRSKKEDSSYSIPSLASRERHGFILGLDNPWGELQEDASISKSAYQKQARRFSHIQNKSIELPAYFETDECDLTEDFSDSECNPNEIDPSSFYGFKVQRAYDDSHDLQSYELYQEFGDKEDLPDHELRPLGTTYGDNNECIDLTEDTEEYGAELHQEPSVFVINPAGIVYDLNDFVDFHDTNSTKENIDPFQNESGDVAPADNSNEKCSSLLESNQIDTENPVNPVNLKEPKKGPGFTLSSASNKKFVLGDDCPWTDAGETTAQKMKFKPKGKPVKRKIRSISCCSELRSRSDRCESSVNEAGHESIHPNHEKISTSTRHAETRTHKNNQTKTQGEAATLTEQDHIQKLVKEASKLDHSSPFLLDPESIASEEVYSWSKYKFKVHVKEASEFRGIFPSMRFESQRAAQDEQDRLLREAAERVRKRETFFSSEQVRNKFMINEGLDYKSPVNDVTELPSTHWIWKNPYSRLGLPELYKCQAVVKKHYRKLALMYHPDKCKKPDAPRRFQAIQEAYEKINAHHGW